MEWKLTASFGGADDVRWETGGNRPGFTQPPVLVDEDLVLSGTWRY